jgi:2-amino-4-hydroxy-6-hydroxymethyldihydropteridine diphosphokinase
MPPAVFLGLGSNLGAREQTLARALDALQARGFLRRRASSLYLTEPVGGPPQDWYVNQVVAGETRLAPEAMLAACQAVEQAFGRERGVKDAPRTLDVDLLLHGDELRDGPELVLPHPRLHERRFVLVPLVEIAPELRHPRLGRTARELLASCSDAARVLPHTPAGRRA